MALSPADAYTSQEMLDTIEELNKKNRQLHERQDTLDAEVSLLSGIAGPLVQATAEWELSGDPDKVAFYQANVSLFAPWNDFIYYGNRPPK